MADEAAVTDGADPTAGSGTEGASTGAGEGGTPQGGPGTPVGAGPTGGTGTQPGGRDNPIPHWRHQELLQAARQQWEQSHANDRQTWEQELYDRLAQGEMARFRALYPGFVEEDQPSYIDAATFDQRMQELNTRWEDRFTAQSAQTEYERMAAKYPEWAQYPGFGTEVWKRWAKNSNLSMDQIGDAYVKELEKYFEAQYAKKQAAAAAVAEETKRKGGPGRMVPGGGGGGAPPKTQGEQRKTVGQRIHDALTQGE